MKAGIHPQYKETTVTCACGNKFTTRSTAENIHTEICSAVPPVLHRQAEAAGQRGPRGQVPVQVRHEEITAPPSAAARTGAARRGSALFDVASTMSKNLCPMNGTQYGGQAVVEGVMMRSPRFFAVACRRLSDNEIVIKREPVENHLRGVQWLNKPFLRGTLALIDAMALGMKALTYAANVQAADQSPRRQAEAPGRGRGRIWRWAKARRRSPGARQGRGEGKCPGPSTASPSALTTVLALVLGFGLFWTLPALLTDKLSASGALHRRLPPGPTWSKAHPAGRSFSCTSA